MTTTNANAPILDYQRPEGRRTRRAILAAVARCEANDERATVRGLAAVLPVSRGAVGQQVRVLADAGLLTTVRGRNGGIYLTEVGRLAAGAD